MKKYIELPLESKHRPRWNFHFGVGTLCDTDRGRMAKIRTIDKSRGAAALCLLAGYVSVKALFETFVQSIKGKR